MREELYPSVWRARHRLALYIAAGAGAAVGLVPGLRAGLPFYNPESCDALVTLTFNDVCGGGAEGRWAALLGWPLFGAAMAGAVIIVWRLMTVPPLGYPGNPVRGAAPPPGHEWKIVDTWPPSGRTDTRPETDREASQSPDPSSRRFPSTTGKA